MLLRPFWDFIRRNDANRVGINLLVDHDDMHSFQREPPDTGARPPEAPPISRKWIDELNAVVTYWGAHVLRIERRYARLRAGTEEHAVPMREAVTAG